jgi:hypothetical protein
MRASGSALPHGSPSPPPPKEQGCPFTNTHPHTHKHPPAHTLRTHTNTHPHTRGERSAFEFRFYRSRASIIPVAKKSTQEVRTLPLTAHTNMMSITTFVAIASITLASAAAVPGWKWPSRCCCAVYLAPNPLGALCPRGDSAAGPIARCRPKTHGTPRGHCTRRMLSLRGFSTSPALTLLQRFSDRTNVVEQQLSINPNTKA